MSTQLMDSPIVMVWAVALPLITILIPVFVSSIFVAIILPSAINVVVNIIIALLTRKDGTTYGQIFVRNIILAVYSILWTHHLFVLISNHQS
jgi:hypothetical protein